MRNTDRVSLYGWLLVAAVSLGVAGAAGCSKRNLPQDMTGVDGGPTGVGGAGIGAPGSGARSTCAQPISIAQARAATRYDDVWNRGLDADIVNSCAVKVSCARHGKSNEFPFPAAQRTGRCMVSGTA